ncbi:GAF domain-containing protein [Saccharopolyspora endophytica]|uniref:GAF domain-containing protein n=1 Tax=Saccharopolyspora endophytica TaxID=543886 RepID=A0ABS5DQL7_9PSEU|nr:GAF domain-containing protein [Saccharopolyspora endophytica]MBQ0928602.1 GAF domain-containing protein [Saccharopolyspora endophytica]
MTHPEDQQILDLRLSQQVNPLRNDPDAPLRRRRLAELGLAHDRPQARLDAFAAELARGAAELINGSLPDAMVNVFAGDHQYFAGMHLPAGASVDATAGLRQQHTAPSRVMSLDTGWCPHVVSRRKALTLPDVFAMVRFSTNEAATKLDIRSYLGAPLLDPDSGVALGTVCVIARDTRPYDRDATTFIKDKAHEAIQLITGRAP